MRAFFSVLGMYNHEEEIFADFRVPEGLDRTTAIHKILFDNAELGLVYTDPAIFPTLIKNWTDSNFYSWERAFQALHSEYNPIHNYDRHEEWTDDETGTNSASETGTSEGTENTDKTSTDAGTRSQANHSNRDLAAVVEKHEDTTHLQAGYNEGNSPVYDYNDALQARNTNSEDEVIDSTENETYSVNTTEDIDTSRSDEYSKTGSGSNTKNAEHEGRIYGNIGVTTTQKMIEEEMELRTKYNLYDMISMSFRSNFCIMVY